MGKSRMVPTEALDLLIQGNRSLLANGEHARRVHLQEIQQIGTALQEPLAVILTCADARISVETVFGRGPGELFTLRVAGNVLTPQQEGSIEFAVTDLHAPLCVVMGHSRCGAISAAVDTELSGQQPKSPNLASLMEALAPSVRCSLHGHHGPYVGTERELLKQRVCWENVRHGVSRLRENHLLSERVSAGHLLIVGAVYELETGIVKFDQASKEWDASDLQEIELAAAGRDR